MSIWPMWTSSATIQLYLTHFLSLSTFILNPSGTQVMLLGFWRSNSTLIWPMWTNCAARKSQLEPASPTPDKRSTSASGRGCHKTRSLKNFKKRKNNYTFAIMLFFKYIFYQLATPTGISGRRTLTRSRPCWSLSLWLSTPTASSTRTGHSFTLRSFVGR